MCCLFLCSGYGDHRDLHVLTHAFPTRRAADLVLNAEDIESSAPANIADYVNDIPSLVGSVTPASSNLNISAGTAGVNALNLRALGTARTLVLLDGQRSVGSTMTGLVDVDRQSTRLTSSH